MAVGFVSIETPGTLFQGFSQRKIFHLYCVFVQCPYCILSLRRTMRARWGKKKLQWLFYDSWQRGHLLHCALTSLTSVLMAEATLHDLAFEERCDQYCALIKRNASLFLPPADVAYQDAAPTSLPIRRHAEAHRSETCHKIEIKWGRLTAENGKCCRGSPTVLRHRVTLRRRFVLLL